MKIPSDGKFLKMSVLEHQQSNIQYGVPSRISQEVKKIYRILGLKASEVPFRIN